MNEFYIASNPNKINHLQQVGNSKLYVKDNGNRRFSLNQKEIFIFISGYVIPRRNTFKDFSHYTQHQLVFELFKKYNKNLSAYIKGIFTVIICRDDDIIIFNDCLGLNKFFIYKSDEEFIISNNIDNINKSIGLNLNKKSIANQALYQHFINNDTCFDNISSSGPASFYSIKNTVEITSYWHWSELTKLKREQVPFEILADKFKEIVREYIEFLKPQGISMTLTGGRDTRTILASLMSIGHKPNVFTFGNSLNADVISSKEIARVCNLTFTNYTYTPSPDWYRELSNEISQTGQSLIHIHRAHRLDAIKREVKRDPSIEMVFMGSMGGDYIKGAHLDDYIISEFVRKYWIEEDFSEGLVKEYLNKFYINDKDELTKKISTALLTHQYKDLSKKDREFAIVHEIVGGAHDYQDINIFCNHVPFVVVPFMDIDFLYDLFSTTYSMFDNHETSGNPLKRMQGGELQCSMIKYLQPNLSKLNFAHPYSPDDLLGNQFIYMLKRIRGKLFKQNNIPGFPYNEWFHKFVYEELNNLLPELYEIFDIEKMELEFKSSVHRSNEGYWHKFSNIIMLSYYIKHFKAEI